MSFGRNDYSVFRAYKAGGFVALALLQVDMKGKGLVQLLFIRCKSRVILPYHGTIGKQGWGHLVQFPTHGKIIPA